MSATIAVDDLRVGMFVHLDLGWWAHPFALSSFKLASADQIVTIRGLGLTQVRWSSERSTLDEPGRDAQPARQAANAATIDAPVADASAPLQTPAARVAESPQEAAAHARRQHLTAQREASALCARQYREAAKSLKVATELVLREPVPAREAVEGLTRALLDKMLIDGEMCIRVLADARSDRATAHALNVTVISMLMARCFGFSAQEMLEIGMGALLHDVGKLELPDRVRHPDPQAPPADQAMYREHVNRGITLAKRMELSPGTLLVIAQHHEMADGSGFPNRLNVDRMSAAARIVALVNRYDNLCDPAVPAHALTPHEALSLIFAQTRTKFDASMLNAFIRMMGVYPPGSVVQLTDDRYALVTNVNSSRPLKPRVLVFDPQVAPDEALHVNLEEQPNLGIRRSLRPQHLPLEALQYLAPRQRVIYYFEPAQSVHTQFGQEIAA